MATTETPLTRAAGTASILGSLEPDQLTQAKLRKIPRRYLRRSQVLLLWSLRLYVLFMIVVVIYQLWAGV